MGTPRIAKMAAELLMDSSSIILQKDDGENVFVFKFHKLECPFIKYSVAVSGKVKHEETAKLPEVFPVICEALAFCEI